MNAVDPDSAYLCRLQLQFFNKKHTDKTFKKLHKVPDNTSSHAGSSFMDKYLARDAKTYVFSYILLLQPQLRVVRSLFADIHISGPKDCYHAQVPLKQSFSSPLKICPRKSPITFCGFLTTKKPLD